MRRMKVMLMVPPGGYFAERWSGGSMMPALGISYVAAVLEADGVDVRVVPCHVLDLDWKGVGRLIETERPDVVGVTTTTENRFLSFRLARVAKAAHPGAFTVLGGPHVMNTAADTLAHVGAVDAVCLGEGEETVRELVACLAAGGDLGKVAGISWRAPDGTVRHNARRMPIADLNLLPMPARHLEPWERYNFRMQVPGRGLLPGGNIMTSRGCPFTCTFCATPANWGRRVRALSPENVLREIEHLRERYGAQVIWFYDDTFNFNPARAERICDMIIERRLDISWFCEVRVDILEKRLFEKMVRAGLFHVGFGIESASERISREVITKRATLQQAFDVVGWSRELGITANPFFIFSHPTETWEEAQKTMRVVEELEGRCETSVAITHVYPGTPLEERARREGKLPRDFSWAVDSHRGVILLPAAQGHAPLYVDRLSWRQICELMVRFGMAKKKIRYGSKIMPVLRNIRSPGDLWRISVLALVLFRHKLLRLLGFERPPRESAAAVPGHPDPGC
jgi:radical SAM superfamily enzyme YgiQ (UPF0313 family)